MFLAQIVALVVCGRLLGEALQRVGQPAVMGQLIAGILLGPFVGALAPHAQAMLFPPDPAQKAMINGVAQLGILLLLVLAGMETEIALVRRVGRQAASVSLGGIVVPFALGFGVGELLPDALLPDPQRRLATSVFLGTALSIASVKIVATVVRGMGFLRRNIGQIIIASAIIDDTIGWVIIALTFGLAATARIEIGPLAISLIGTAIFLVAAFTIGRRLVIATIRWTNDTFVTELPVISAIIALAGAFALATHGLGVHSVLGAFVAGVLIGESPILTERIERELRGLTQALFMLVFFGLAGLGTDLTVLGKTDTGHGDRLHPDRQPRQVRRRLSGRALRRIEHEGVPRARLRHERARLDRGHRRHHRIVARRARPAAVLDHRGDGGGDDDGDAADAALGAAPPAVAR